MICCRGSISLACRFSLLALACVSSTLRADPPPSREVTVHVSVRTPDGVPVSGAPIGVYGFEVEETATSGITDSEGNATLIRRLRAAATHVAVEPRHHAKMFRGRAGLWLPEQERAALQAVVDAHFIKAYQWVELQPGVQEYSVQVIAYPATRLHAIPRQASGEVDSTDWHAYLRDSLAFGGTYQGALEISGLRRGADNEVFLQRDADGRVVRLVVPAGQCAGEEATIEPLVLPGVASGARTKITISRNFDPVLKAFPIDARIRLSLVSSDGSAAFEFMTAAVALWDVNNKSGKVVDAATNSEWVTLPAGTYYVASGSITQGVGARLWDAIRAGRTEAQVVGAGIPKITVVPNQDNEFTIDRVSAYQGLQKLCGFD